MIAKMLECSTAHITEETREWLASEALQYAGHLTVGPLIVYEKSIYGCFIYVPEQLTDEEKVEIPEDLVQIMLLAQQEKCGWLMLDGDVEPMDSLPIYDW